MSEITVLEAREVPLGGLRALTVRRTLPHRDRSFIGAWCFADHYGPTPVDPSTGMDVAPHPHTGLQTVSWLFTGEVEHRDSTGAHAIVRPGQLNLMTAGRGVSHSEVSTPDTTLLHGVQLWVVLPSQAAPGPPRFEHYAPPSATRAGATIRVFIGDLDGQHSPVITATPLLGAEVILEPGASWSASVDVGFEHGVLVDTGTLQVDAQVVNATELAAIDAGREQIRVVNVGAGRARFILLGGTPFAEDVIMWWNFIARSHEEMVLMRAQWQAGDERFGQVHGYVGRMARIPAPALPSGRLTPRRRAFGAR